MLFWRLADMQRPELHLRKKFRQLVGKGVVAVGAAEARTFSTSENDVEHVGQTPDFDAFDTSLISCSSSSLILGNICSGIFMASIDAFSAHSEQRWILTFLESIIFVMWTVAGLPHMSHLYSFAISRPPRGKMIVRRVSVARSSAECPL